jgi:hypothetical protein
MVASVNVARLLGLIPSLSPTQIGLILAVAGQFTLPRSFNLLPSTHNFSLAGNLPLLTQDIIDDLGESMRIHHAFSREAFTKDKFEYALERSQILHGRQASLTRRGNPGADVVIEGQRFALKTEASQSIKLGRIHISKFMELGGGVWGSNPADLLGLRQQFLNHLQGYDHILILRRLAVMPRQPTAGAASAANPGQQIVTFRYELVAIPKAVMASAVNGTLVMQTGSKQLPRPGYCYVGIPGWTHQVGQPVKASQLVFALYFDGGGERKLQIKHLDKQACAVLAEWTFDCLQI